MVRKFDVGGSTNPDEDTSDSSVALSPLAQAVSGGNPDITQNMVGDLWQSSAGTPETRAGAVASPMQQLQQLAIANRTVDQPGPNERKNTLAAYQNAIRTAGVDETSPTLAYARGILSAKNPFDPIESFSSANNYFGNWLDTQRESVAKREALATQAQYADVVARAKAADDMKSSMLPLMQQQNATMRQGLTMYTQALEGARKQAEVRTDLSPEQRNEWIFKTATKNTVDALRNILDDDQIRQVLPKIIQTANALPDNSRPAMPAAVTNPTAVANPAAAVAGLPAGAAFNALIPSNGSTPGRMATLMQELSKTQNMPDASVAALQKEVIGELQKLPEDKQDAARALLARYIVASQEGRMTPELATNTSNQMNTLYQGVKPFSSATPIPASTQSIQAQKAADEAAKAQAKVPAANEEARNKDWNANATKLTETYGSSADAANEAAKTFVDLQNALDEYKRTDGSEGALASLIAKAKGIGVSLLGGKTQTYAELFGDDALKNLSVAQQAKKLQFNIGTAVAKAINPSRVTQQEVMMSLENTPGIDMLSNASKQILGTMLATANRARERQQAYQRWKDAFGTNGVDVNGNTTPKPFDPGNFQSYWSTVEQLRDPTTQRHVLNDFSPEALAALVNAPENKGKSIASLIAKIPKFYQAGVK